MVKRLDARLTALERAKAASESHAPKCIRVLTTDENGQELEWNAKDWTWEPCEPSEPGDVVRVIGGIDLREV